MIAFPAGVKVWIAGGVTDMRCGMSSLALKVQLGLGRDPHGGEIFCFWGRKGDLIKLLWHDGVGMSLYMKRLEVGKFIWPVSQSGSAVPVSAAQLGYLLEGIDWRNPRWTQRPTWVMRSNPLVLLELVRRWGRSSVCRMPPRRYLLCAPPLPRRRPAHLLRRALVAARSELTQVQAVVSAAEEMIRHLRLPIAKLRREQYGHSAERHAG